MCLRGFACFLRRVITYTLPRTLQLYAGYSLFGLHFTQVACFCDVRIFSSFFSSCVLLQLTAGCYFAQDTLLTQSFTVRPITMFSMSRFFVAIPHRILFLLTVHIYRCIDNTSIYFSCCILRRLLDAFSDYLPLNPYKSFV